MVKCKITYEFVFQCETIELYNVLNLYPSVFHNLNIQFAPSVLRFKETVFEKDIQNVNINSRTLFS